MKPPHKGRRFKTQEDKDKRTLDFHRYLVEEKNNHGYSVEFLKDMFMSNFKHCEGLKKVYQEFLRSQNYQQKNQATGGFSSMKQLSDKVPEDALQRLEYFEAIAHKNMTNPQLKQRNPEAEKLQCIQRHHDVLPLLPPQWLQEHRKPLQTPRKILKRGTDWPQEIDEPVWLKYENEKVGHFFVNKILDPDYQEDSKRYWNPKHLDDSVTQLLSLDELIKFQDLQSAIVCNVETFENCSPFLEIFPESVHLTVLCNIGHTQLKMGTSIFETRKVFMLSSDGSRKEKQIPVVQPSILENMKCSFMILRYKDHLRLIISGLSWVMTIWQSFAQTGWYIDFPITSSWDNARQDSAGGVKMQNSLHVLLSSLGVSFKILDGVYFDCSPAVNLLLTHPVVDYKQSTELFGLEKLKQIMKSYRWLDRKPIKSIYQTTWIGSDFSISASIFGNAMRNKEDVKIIYPSKNAGVNFQGMLEAERIHCNKLHYNARNGLCIPYLHNIEEKRVLPFANVALQYQDLNNADSSGSKRFGWLMVGSHSLTRGDWDKRGYHNVQNYTTCQLSVVISPYTDQEGKTCAIDLKEVGFLFDEGMPYLPNEIPLGMTSDTFHCLGVLMFANQRSFLEPITLDQAQIGIFDKIPKVQGDTNPRVWLTHHPAARFHASLSPGTLYEFIAVMQGNPSRRKYTVLVLCDYFATLKDAYKKHGLGFLKNGIPKKLHPAVASGFELWDDKKQCLKQTQCRLDWQKCASASIEEELFLVGVNASEEIESYLQDIVAKDVLQYIDNKFPAFSAPPKDVDWENEYPWRPKAYSGSQDWTRKHVVSMCHGSIPPTVGPYHMDTLSKLYEHSFNLYINGL